jgi:hypothetical protein
MKITVTEIAIHKENQSPIFGELTTKVGLGDEGGGVFVKITQNRDDGLQEVRIDFDEVEYIMKAIEMLKEGDHG